MQMEKVVNYPISEKIWAVIRGVAKHQKDCVFCDDPRVAEKLINALNKEKTIEQIAQELQISSQTILDHIKNILGLQSGELLSRIALLKIIAKIDEDTNILSDVKVGDVIKAINALYQFEAVKGKEKFHIDIKKDLTKVSSADLMFMRKK